jgi:hypothetical protein
MHNLKSCRAFSRFRCEHAPAITKGLVKGKSSHAPAITKGLVKGKSSHAPGPDSKHEGSLKEVLEKIESLDNPNTDIFLYTALKPEEQLLAKRWEPRTKYAGVSILCLVSLSVLLLLTTHGLGISRLLIQKEGKLMQSFKDLLVRVSQEVRLFLYTFTWPY